MPKKDFGIPVRFAIITISALIGLFLLNRYLSFFMRSTGYFLVKDVFANQPNIDISYLKGENIFLLDLRKESGQLLRAYPHFEKVILIKQFPDRITAILKNRQALAYIHLDKDFLIDAEGVLFPAPVNLSLADLPLITGSSKINHRDIRIALDIINQMRVSGISKQYPLKKITFLNPAQVSVFILQETEIKMAKADTLRQLKNLASLLNDAKIDAAKIKYIDLRFKEPTVMFLNEK